MLTRYAVPATAARSAARVAVLGAILSALFLMHGTAVGVGGCQGAAAMPTMTAMQASAPPAADGHGARSVSGSGAVGSHHIPAPAIAAGGVESPHATVCLSTAPRRQLAVALLAAAGVAVPPVTPWRPGNLARRTRRRTAHAPPGRALLARLCVSRT